MTLGYLAARALTAPPRPRSYPIRVHELTPTHITVDRRGQTATAGTWGIFLDDGTHLRVHGRPEILGRAARWPLATPPTGRRARRASWSGIVDPAPDALGLTWETMPVATPAGRADAWLFQPHGAPAPDALWAVHVHGMGSSRAGTLRGVRAAAQAGLPSMVVSYRNTLEGPRLGSGASTLGLTEIGDVLAALQELRDRCVRRVVMFGWSMGAQMALGAAVAPPAGLTVAGVVLDSPVISWRPVLAANARHARLPAVAAAGAAGWLRGARRSRMLGLPGPVDVDALDWTARAGEVTVPVLAHHGGRDWSVPVQPLRDLAEAAADVTVREVPEGGHTTVWNVDPAGWDLATEGFLRGL